MSNKEFANVQQVTEQKSFGGKLASAVQQATASSSSQAGSSQPTNSGQSQGAAKER